MTPVSDTLRKRMAEIVAYECLAADGPTVERLRKAMGEVEEFITDTGRRTHRMLDGSVLDMLLSRGAISADLYHAGAQFYEDWYLSGMAASGVIDPGRVVVDGGQHQRESDRKLDAMTRWKFAVRKLGMLHSQVLTEVVLCDTGLVAYGRRRYAETNDNRARLRATTSLINALTELDLIYYGQRQSRMRRSHAEDYRPTIQPPGGDDHERD